MKNLAEWEREAKGKTCKSCKKELKGTLGNYEHPAGYEVEGSTSPRWLYIICDNCRYENSFVKLGIKKED